ncbi:MAG TPA: hypothetical protein VMK42_08500 [Anaeromyxobacteraceae bacterium]|nr:hypothetical protein [Anaeromyxobacteraceae bacterium]
MTSYQLYAIYVGAYSDSSPFAERADGGGRSCSPPTWLGSIERAIAELAAHDATNGTPMRSKREFDRSLEEGAELLERLYLRDRCASPHLDGKGGAGEGAWAVPTEPLLLPAAGDGA